MPIIYAMLLGLMVSLSLLMLLKSEDDARPMTLMDAWCSQRIQATKATTAPQASKEAQQAWIYCERTKRYRDAVTKRFIPSPVV